MVQPNKQLNLTASLRRDVRKDQTDITPADYVLFVDRKPIGIIEANRADKAIRLITVEEQSLDYATAKLEHLNNAPLPFVYEKYWRGNAFTDYCAPKLGKFNKCIY